MELQVSMLFETFTYYGLIHSIKYVSFGLIFDVIVYMSFLSLFRHHSMLPNHSLWPTILEDVDDFMHFLSCLTLGFSWL